MTLACDAVITGARIATLDTQTGYGLIEDGAIGLTAGAVAYVGSSREAPHGRRTFDVNGSLVTPALVDCHTHLVFAGDRLGDFEARLAGSSYAEIAGSGGGITRTMAATRLASEDELYDLAAPRVRWLMDSGVATVEVKSGYGLETETELRMLRVARRLGAELPVTIRTSLLAAHAVPPEFADDPDGYVDIVCRDVIPTAAAEGLADAVDAFCEAIAFSPDQVIRIFAAADDAGLPVRLHADQLSDLGGASLAAEHSALSADHLEHANPAGIAAMADAGTVAVLIPGAATFLDEAKRPPLGEIRRAGVPIAVATDLNPGTAPLGSLQIAMALAASRFGLTPAEALAGATRHAAAALGLQDRGVIEVGARADIALWNLTDPAGLSYWFGAPLLRQLWIDGERVEGIGIDAR